MGTLILLQMESSGRSQPGNYPTGRHSRFQAVTKSQNEWERLKLELLDQPDANTSARTIDQFVFLFGSNTNLNNTFYFDNFDSYAEATPVPTIDGNKDGALIIYPNPTEDFLILKNIDLLKGHVLMYDLFGKVVTPNPINITSSNQLINISHLTTGIYFLKFTQGINDHQVVRLIKS